MLESTPNNRRNIAGSGSNNGNGNRNGTTGELPVDRKFAIDSDPSNRAATSPSATVTPSTTDPSKSPSFKYHALTTISRLSPDTPSALNGTLNSYFARFPNQPSADFAPDSFNSPLFLPSNNGISSDMKSPFSSSSSLAGVVSDTGSGTRSSSIFSVGRRRSHSQVYNTLDLPPGNSFHYSLLCHSQVDLLPSGTPEIQGCKKLIPIYPHYPFSISMYRSEDLQTGKPVIAKGSSLESLEDLTRIRQEWTLLNENSISNQTSPCLNDIPQILRPFQCRILDSNPSSVFLIYPNVNNLVTLRERYLPQESQDPIASRSVGDILHILHSIIAILQTISQVHCRNITHHGLTTSTIFIDDNDETWLSGWDFSFPLRAEDTSRGYRKKHLTRVADCMGYVSPETTGVTNRLVDFRTDFYSIGCILYELLVGYLPFRSSDTSELSHMHVLRPPAAPSLVAPWVPPALSSLVLKLLEKNAIDRYQTADLIVTDLQYIAGCLSRNEPIDEDFVPAVENNVSPVFLISQLLYGRFAELNVLQSCYKRNQQNGFQFVFCLGEQGSGKTRLVNELERLSISHNTFYCVSKYDQYQRGPPFYSIVTILRDILHQILSGSVNSINQWRDLILSNVKVELAVLFGPVPELKELLGREYFELLPKPQRLGPVARELRFKFVVKSLLYLFGTPGLTVFLDDLQWCPDTELSLFRELATFVSGKHAGDVHITLVCASSSESLQRYSSLVSFSKDMGLPYEEIQLSQLPFDAVQHLIADTLAVRKTTGRSNEKRGSFSLSAPTLSSAKPSMRALAQISIPEQESMKTSNLSVMTSLNNSPNSSIGTLLSPGNSNSIIIDPQVDSLSEIVYNITQGNPLFISLLLKYLYFEKFIYFDESNRLTGGRWKVDFDRLNLRSLPRSISDVVITMVKSLPEKAVRILKYSACICSNSFTLRDVAVGSDVTITEAASALRQALDLQLILPSTMHYKYPFSEPVNNDTPAEAKETNSDPLSTDHSKGSPEEALKVSAASSYRFYHDLVQQAVYSLLEEREALETHRLIGLHLLGKDHNKSQSTNRVIEIANQLKNAVPIVKEEEKNVYIQLNIRAGHAVYGMSDFDMAYSYYSTARQLLTQDPDHFSRSPDISRNVYLNLVELQYNRKSYSCCLDLVKIAFPGFINDIDKAALLRTKAKSLYALGYTDEAISTGLQALRLTGFNIEEDEEANRINYERLRTRIPLSLSEIRELVNLKSTADPALLLAHEIISIITIPVILSFRPHLFRSLVYTAVAAFVDHGSAASCSFSLLSLASLFQKGGGNANLIRAYEYSKLAIVTLACDTAIGLDFGINIYEYYALTLAIYFEPLSEVIRYYDIVMSSGQTFEDHCGMLSLSYDLRPLCTFLAGEPLQRTYDYFKRMKPVALQSGDRTGKLWILLHQRGFQHLMGVGLDDVTTETSFLEDGGIVKEILESKVSELIYAFFVLKLLLAVIYRHKYVAAEIICSDLPEFISRVPVTVYHVMVTFYGALAIVEKGPSNEREDELLSGFVQDLQDWSRTNPSMFSHKYLLLKAEMSKGSYNEITTLDIYEEAIKLALEEGFIQEAALVNERCGDYLQVHSKKRSLAYLKESIRLYSLWGAHKKVDQLTTRYPEILAQAYDIPRMSISSTDLPSTSSTNFRQRNSLSSKSLLVNKSSPLRWILSNLFKEDNSETKDDSINKGLINKIVAEPLTTDLSPVDSYAPTGVISGMNSPPSAYPSFELRSALQACLEISEAIEINSITVKLIESVISTSEADYCVFISLDEEDGELYLESIGVLGRVTIVPHESLYLRSEVAPISVIHQVVATGTTVTRYSDPKAFDLIYGRDPFFETHRAQSVLCVPIQNQIKIVGALYVEQNDDQRNEYQQQRVVELIGLLCTQAAVSIDKARLYRQMDLAKKTAEEATAEKASFLANMSHEIRTPFNALLSCSIFLLDTELNEIQREYVETIRSSAMLTLNIIDAILAFSKIEHGSITLENSPFSLRECVESAIQLVAEPAATKDLELVHLNKCCDVDLIYGDVTRVRQIIINLVGNAVKFTSSGHIVVETHAEKVSSDDRYEFVISVSDTGIGIPKKARNKIFRAFSQVDGSSRRVYGGSGLGLAISKKLAELMGGTLSFESEEGRGTTFWFNVVARAQNPKKNHRKDKYLDLRCLVADHHAIVKESLKNELQRLGFVVDECSTSDEVIDIVKSAGQNFYSLIFIDSKLIKEDCHETQKIKALSPATYLIYMTIFGGSIPEDTEKNGISALLMRPIQRSRLKQIIRKVMQSSKAKASASLPDTNKHGLLDNGMISSLSLRYPLKLLLAEDNPINTRVALQHLKRMGYNADHAKDGVEVLDLCAKELSEGRPMYDCILMDIQMPQKDGIATAQELKELYPSNIRPSVIALTANAAGEDRQKCLSIGMVNYLAKPILPADLAAVLMSVKPLKQLKELNDPNTQQDEHKTGSSTAQGSQGENNIDTAAQGSGVKEEKGELSEKIMHQVTVLQTDQMVLLDRVTQASLTAGVAQ